MRGEVVPNGEAVTVDLLDAGAAEPDFFPLSDEVAMSKMPLLPGCFDAVLPEFDDAGADSRPPRELPLADAPCPVRDWAARVQQTSMQKKAASAVRILMCPFLSWVNCRARGMRVCPYQ